MQSLDVSERGYWRSFYAAFYGLPLLVLASILVPLDLEGQEAAKAAAEDGGFVFDLVGFLLYYAINWLYWPLAAVYLTRNLGLFERYSGYIVAYNWGQLIVLAMQAGILLAGTVIFGDATPLLVPVFLLALAANWSIARHALGIAALPAVMLTGLDLVLGQAFHWFVTTVTG